MNKSVDGKYNHSLSEAFQELKAQLRIANPTIVGLLFYKIPWLISLHFAAELGAESLAAAALATTLCNVTGMSVAVGLGYGLATLTGQGKGGLLLKGEVNALKEKKKSGGERSVSDDTYSSRGSASDESTPLLSTATISNNSTDQENSGSSSISNIKDLTKERTENDAELGDQHVLLDVDADADEDDDSYYPLPPMVYLYRGLFIQFLVQIPIGIWFISGIGPFLLWLGQKEELSLMTEEYLRVLTPGLWSYSINWTFTFWLSSIDMANVTAWSSILGALLHIPFNTLFVTYLGFGYEGVAMATVMFQLIQPFATCIYLFGTVHGRERLLENTGAKAIGRTKLDFYGELEAAVTSFAGIRQYVALGLPGVVVISEWWASEICIFLAGQLQPDSNYALGSMSIYQSINSFCYMFPVGFSSAASARVGLFLGKNDPAKADLASKVSLCGAAILAACMGCILWFTPHGFFPWLFTSDEGVIAETAATISFSAFYVFADGMQSALTGNLKGCGMQALAVPVVIVAYWFVGVPFAYYNSFIRHEGSSALCEPGDHFCGITGLVAGTTAGTFVHFLGLLLVYIFAINWENESDKARERVALEKRTKQSQLEQKMNSK